MATYCKLKHADPDVLPRELCRECHPELNLNERERSRRDRISELTQEIDRKLSLKQYELNRAKEQLAKLDGRRGHSRGAKNAAVKVVQLEKEIYDLTSKLAA